MRDLGLTLIFYVNKVVNRQICCKILRKCFYR